MPPFSVGHPATKAADPLRVPRRAARNARTSEVVAASIRSQVARGELKAGDRFPPEDQLMEIFGIARTTLREALRILEAEGLVTVVRGRHGGPRVTTPTVEHLTRLFALLLQIEGVAMTDVYAALAVIEPQMAGRLARNRDPRMLAELKTVIETAAAAAGEEGATFSGAAAAVHEKIFEHAGNASLAIFARLLRELVTQHSRRSGQAADRTGRRRALRSYRKLYKLVEAGDADGAEAHWRSQMSYPSSHSTQPVDLFS
ncbi:FadR/GntR family transcriptional regulator [Frankia sp. QA3]|uniref:FadR/GntR family transcriptional regulator n=1 Tax=Frankia sp. QA3 TaxID=710111 RepID=UPI000269BDCC|nr:GntR family transcriptional regulator [Frankia sp. QA3]EIV92311.1 transcriptional regulator [Frankia sp. QA3]